MIIVNTEKKHLLNKQNKINELEAFYKSEEFRTIEVLGAKILNQSWFRSLISEQVVNLKQKIDLKLITEKTAFFPYNDLPNNKVIPLPYRDMIKIIVKLTDEINNLFALKQGILSEINKADNLDVWLAEGISKLKQEKSLSE